MFLIKLEDGQPVGNAVMLDNFKLCNPDLSLPFPLLPEHIEPHGYGIYDFSMQPAHGTFQIVEEVAPSKGAGGIWYQTWAVRPMTDEEQVARIWQEWDTVRDRRNYSLATCDWTQLPDAPVDSTVWAEYRQALRDITNQDDPFNIIWPQEPE